MPEPAEHMATLEELGGTLAGLRLCDDEGIARMRDSLLRQGQLMAVMVFRQGDLLEVVDGFKRLRAAQQLGWQKLQVRELLVDSVGAKAALMMLNQGHGLTELEEAWLVRALYRHDRLGQPQIARLLSRDKSWVSRRLLLAEGLDETVTADVRLGLIGSGAATAVARLPRGNQRTVTDLAMRQGLTRHQVERLVTDLIARPAEERATVISQMMARARPVAEARPPSTGWRRPRTLAEWIAVDITIITRQCARLQARLLQQPLATLGEQAARLTTDGLVELRLALEALARSIARATATENGGDGRADA
jgi:ParB-like chromosome segregation protein Spo0J